MVVLKSKNQMAKTKKAKSVNQALTARKELKRQQIVSLEHTAPIGARIILNRLATKDITALAVRLFQRRISAHLGITVPRSL